MAVGGNIVGDAVKVNVAVGVEGGKVDVGLGYTRVEVGDTGIGVGELQGGPNEPVLAVRSTVTLPP